MIRIDPRRLGVLAVLAVATLALWVWPRGQAEAACGPAAMGVEGQSLLGIQETYALLGRLRDGGCLPLTPEMLEAYMQTTELNMVSFALIESQTTLASAARRGDLLVAEYVQTYAAAKGEADPALLLTLADLAMFACGADEACTGARIRAALGDHRLSAAAACFYGMAGLCDAALAQQVPLLNAATLAALPASARAAQAEYLCARYMICV